MMIALLSSCGHVRKKSQAYVATNSPTTLNGAAISCQLQPEGNYGMGSYNLSAMILFAAGENLKGPYRAIISAKGQKDVHQWMTIESLSLSTQSGKTQSLPADQLNKWIYFEPDFHGSNYYATYRCPVKMTPDWNSDGQLTLNAVVSIATKAGTQRARITQVYRPEQLNESRFVNIPAEIYRDLRKR